MTPEDEYLQLNGRIIANIEDKLSGKNRIVRDAISRVYNQIAKLITKALFTLGIDSCAYIIYNFPKNIRESVLELIKKEIQRYDDFQKLVDRSDLEIKGGSFLWESGSDFDKNFDEQRHKIGSILKAKANQINKYQWKEVTTYFGSTNNTWDFSVKLIRIGLICMLSNFVAGDVFKPFSNIELHVGAHAVFDLTLWIGKELYFWNSTTTNPLSHAAKNSSSAHVETKDERRKRKMYEKIKREDDAIAHAKAQLKSEKKRSSKKGGSRKKKGRSVTQRRFKIHSVKV
jgi:hypothetical protein